MPIDVRRFGVGHRRPDGPPGTTGIEGQVIESGRSGIVAELAFNRRARITPHSNPNWTYFLVIEGGGWVGVGDERTRVTAGEAVVWPPDVIHARLDGRVADARDRRGVRRAPAGPARRHRGPGGPDRAGRAGESASREWRRRARRVSRGEGRLAPRPAEPPADGDNPEGEPR